METEDKKDLIVKFPEDEKQISSASPVEQSIGTTQATPDNPFDKGAELLPRALSAIKENFKEAIFLFIVLGYIFVAAFGHMEKIENYVGYFFVFLVSIFIYKIWDKIKSKDIFYIIIILILLSYQIFTRFSVSILNWLWK